MFILLKAKDARHDDGGGHPPLRALQRDVLGRLAAARRPQRPRRPDTRWCSPATASSPSSTSGFAAAGSGWPLAVLFAAYGLYIAATEGTSKALIGRAIPTGERASALGLYYTASGLASFAASTVGGVLWTAVGPWATFTFGAAAAAWRPPSCSSAAARCAGRSV